jgi:hypothetical protein
MPPNNEETNQRDNEENELRPAAPNYDNDPLLRLIGSGKHIWADEHADEYVENLRREDT